MSNTQLKTPLPPTIAAASEGLALILFLPCFVAARQEGRSMFY